MFALFKEMKKQSKQPISKIQRQLWQECRRVADILYPPKNGATYCYTCDKPISGSNKQLGHFIPKGACGANLKYDVYRNLRWQCYHDNINLGGNGTEFYRRMVRDHGQEYVDKIFQDKNITVKAYDYFVELLDKYKQIC
jgi:hypothetical protein